jgi:anti-anti-sigma regulatory factor
VLRITELPRRSTRTLKLEGKLVGPWVDELRIACTPSVAASEHLRLDLHAVTFVDAAGADLLGELIRQGARITRCSPFVAEMLDEK